MRDILLASCAHGGSSRWNRVGALGIPGDDLGLFGFGLFVFVGGYGKALPEGGVADEGHGG